MVVGVPVMSAIGFHILVSGKQPVYATVHRGINFQKQKSEVSVYFYFSKLNKNDPGNDF